MHGWQESCGAVKTSGASCSAVLHPRPVLRLEQLRSGAAVAPFAALPSERRRLRRVVGPCIGPSCCPWPGGPRRQSSGRLRPDPGSCGSWRQGVLCQPRPWAFLGFRGSAFDVLLSLSSHLPAKAETLQQLAALQPKHERSWSFVLRVRSVQGTPKSM